MQIGKSFGVPGIMLFAFGLVIWKVVIPYLLKRIEKADAMLEAQVKSSEEKAEKNQEAFINSLHEQTALTREAQQLTREIAESSNKAQEAVRDELRALTEEIRAWRRESEPARHHSKRLAS